MYQSIEKYSLKGVKKMFIWHLFCGLATVLYMGKLSV